MKRVQVPTFKVNDLVYLHSGRAKAHSPAVLSHHRYGTQKYIITKIVERQSSFVPSSDRQYPLLSETSVGPSYLLTNISTGKCLRQLCPAVRLKLAVDTTELDTKFPPLQPKPQPPIVSREELTAPESDGQLNNNDNSDNNAWFPARCLLAKRTLQGKTEYLVKFTNGDKSWHMESDVSDLLKTRFYAKKALASKRRQKQLRDRFRNS